MTSPAPVTSRLDWDDLIAGLYETVTDIYDLGGYVRDLYDERRDRDLDDDGAAATNASLIEEALEQERRDDIAADGRLDGDYDLDPEDR